MRFGDKIVGIVGHVQSSGLDSDSGMQLYIPSAQFLNPHFVPNSMSLVVRTGSDPMSMLPTIERTIHRTDDDVPVNNPRTFEQIISESLTQRRLSMLLVFDLCGHCPDSNSRRHLWCRLLLRSAADARDRHSCSARNNARRYFESHCRTRTAARAARHRHRLGGIVGLDALHGQPAIWRQRYGPGHVRRCSLIARSRSAFGQLYPGARRATRIDPIRALRTE